MQRKLWLITGIVVLLACIYPTVYIYSLSTVHVQDFQLTGVKFDPEGMVVTGTMVLANQGFLEVMIDRMDYTIIFEPTGLQMGQGQIAGVHIAPSDTSTTAFSATMQYPSIADLPKLLKEKEDTVRIDGKATATFLGIPFHNSFTVTFDAKVYLQQYLNEKLGALFG